MNLTHETSAEALSKFNAQDKKVIHYKIIMDALKNCPYPLSSYGIAQRTSLDRYQISRRTSELERLNKIYQVGTKIDLDNAKRTIYSLTANIEVNL